MKLAVASDHAGFELKEKVRLLLESQGHTVEDCGCYSEESCDYPDYANRLCEAILGEKAERGVLVCGTGLGMSYTANRHKGIRAALCTSAEMAEMSRAHNDANVLVLGSRILDTDIVDDVLNAWMETPFDGGRHLRRIRKIDGLD
jgi:ribose 5-phosphate isomerase B